jgi:type IV pilus assembly protein PilE
MVSLKGNMKKEKGLTLIELLIVIVIVGILAGVAIPVYTGYIQRARRADAKTALEQVRAAMEMWRAEHGSYAATVAELQNTMGAPATSINNYYNWNFTVLNANSFTARAQALGSQATDGNLFIDFQGQKWDSDGNFYPQGKWGK